MTSAGASSTTGVELADGLPSTGFICNGPNVWAKCNIDFATLTGDLWMGDSLQTLISVGGFIPNDVKAALTDAGYLHKQELEQECHRSVCGKCPHCSQWNTLSITMTITSSVLVLILAVLAIYFLAG